MKRLAVFGAALLVVLAGAFSAAAYGGPQTSASACSGKLVINVTQKVVNDDDSGIGGYWAKDQYNRQIQIWQQDANTFCATVDYQGSFVTLAGPSPSGAGTVSAGIKGNMNGGRRAIITGSLLASPAWRTKGSLGTIDYMCDGSGNCPGYLSYLDAYFAVGYGYTDTWWGWQYRTAKNGTWVNSSDGNTGDITG